VAEQAPVGVPETAPVDAEKDRPGQTVPSVAETSVVPWSMA
jgi:hypothetical protein